MKASPLCYVFLLQYWNCLYLRSLAIQLFQEVNSLVLLAQMQTENPFGCPATATEFYASTCECEHWNCICYLKSNSLKYKDCTFWSPDTNPARKNPKKAMIAFFQQKIMHVHRVCTWVRNTFKHWTPIFLKRHWMGAEKKKRISFLWYCPRLFLTGSLPIPSASRCPRSCAAWGQKGQRATYLHYCS